MRTLQLIAVSSLLWAFDPTVWPYRSECDCNQPQPPPPESVGVWFVLPKQSGLWDFPFYYDGETVTIRWVIDSGLTRASPDDHYRFKARWVGDDLHYLNPLRKWEKLATFKNGRFQKELNGKRWEYETIGLTNVWNWSRWANWMQKHLLVERALYDYSIDFFDW